MNEVTAILNQRAATDYSLIDRGAVLEAGGSDRMITSRISSGTWQQVQSGVYQVGVGPLSWKARLRAATMAAGPLAVASHRAALVLWGLEGLQSAPIEVTVPVGKGPVPAGAIVHRTRRPIEATVVEGIPVSKVERSLIDGASLLPTSTLEIAYDCALRKKLTSAESMACTLSEEGYRGVRGRGKIAFMLDSRRPGRPAGSPAETLILRYLRRAGIEEPERQYIVILPDGSVAIIDLAWPRYFKGVEIDGLDAHGSAKALEHDLTRQNLLFEVRWELRRFSARSVRRHPEEVVESIARFLAA